MKDLDPWTLPLAGTALIEASAGTGKTYTLTTLYLRLLVERDLLPSQILVVTYTQAATAELRERVRERIRKAIAAGEADDREASQFDAQDRRLGQLALSKSRLSGGSNPLRRALREFDEAAIFTIHGFCQRTLSQNAFESGVAFDVELIEGAELLEQTLARDLWARGIAEQAPAFVEWLLQGKGKRWRFEPEALRRDLLAQLGADEQMPILPEVETAAAERIDLEDLTSEVDRTFRSWAGAWPAGRDRFVPWLREAPDLNRNRYRVATIANVWVPELERLCEVGIADSGDRASQSFEIPVWWEKWTREALVAGLKKGGQLLEDPILDDFGEVASAVERLENAYSRQALSMRRQFVDRAREEGRRRREERHQLVFDDLLSELRAALRPPRGRRLAEALRAQYRFALIDEFQDTDPVQYEIFRGVWHASEPVASDGSAGGLILIGDPKQAIYSFRGADLFTYLAAKQDAGAAIYGLNVNWRSGPGLISAINALFGRPRSAFGFDAIEFNPVMARPDAPEGLQAKNRSGAGLRVLLADYERGVAASAETARVEAEAKPKKKSSVQRFELPLRFGRTELMHAFARDIAELLDGDAKLGERPVRPSDVAVLCRRKSELARARRALEALGIPCVDRGDADVFESREAWELLCVLRAMLRSGDPARLRAALATGALGWNARALAEIGDDSAELAQISERYAEYARIWRQSGFMRAFEAWRRHEGVTTRLLELLDGERRLTNWLHLAELLQRVASERSPSRVGLASWLERAIADPEARKMFGSEASLLRLESDDEAVSLITLHRSKGLEYEIVYLPCLWEDASRGGSAESAAEKAAKGEGQIPPVRCHDRDRGQRILDLGSPAYGEHRTREEEEAKSEALRLLYVGLTRAKSQCVVMWGAIGTGKYASTPLAWLLAAPEWEAAGKARSDSVAEIRSWNDARWREVWDSLGEVAGADSVSIEPAIWDARARWQSPDASRSDLQFETISRALPRARITTSFSGLTRGSMRSIESSVGPAEIGRDLDADTAHVHANASTPETEQARELASDLAAGMDRFPRGADAGTLLHEVLEQVEFSEWDEARVRPHATQLLERHGFDAACLEQILHVVRSVAETPLRHSPEPFRLADLAPGQLLSEMEFTLAAPGQAEGEGFTPAALAAVLERAPANSPLERYAPRVDRLGWRGLRGYLRGFIDAIVFDGERYFLIDYKSNHLGALQSDYSPENLLSPMIDHDYVLQYLIYSIALDRYLARTLEGYTYDTHFGGVYYLFLRGMAVSHAPACGVFHDRPEERTVRDVARLLGSSPGEGGVP